MDKQTKEFIRQHSPFAGIRDLFAWLIVHIARIIPRGKFSPASYWRHSENKYLYLCLSEKYILDDERSGGEQKFIELFPKAIRISQREFDTILFFYPDIDMITVADDTIHSMIEQNDEAIRIEEKKSDGVYADDEHEESED